MKKIYILLCLFMIAFYSSCNEYRDGNVIGEKDDVANMENDLNKDLANADMPTADVDTINKTSMLISKKEIENHDLVTTDSDMLSPHELHVTYTNKSGNTLMYGQGFVLQVLNDDWTEIPILPTVGWKDISYNLNAGESFGCDVDLIQLFGELEKGHYRIIKEMFTESTKLYVIVEFEL